MSPCRFSWAGERASHWGALASKIGFAPFPPLLERVFSFHSLGLLQVQRNRYAPRKKPVSPLIGFLTVVIGYSVSS